MSETTRCKEHPNLKARFTCPTCGVNLCSACGDAHTCDEGQGDA